MNRNTSAVILIVLAVGIYLTYTSGQWEKVKAVRAVNDGYAQAIKNADQLISLRDKVLADYNSLTVEDKDRLNKMVPNTVDNIRLIIDLNNIAVRHGLSIQGIKAETAAVTNKNDTAASAAKPAETIQNLTLDKVKVAFTVSATYQQFIDFMHDVESDLRIMDFSHITMTSSDTGIYNFNVELNTYWLRDQ
jgi:Tfp pilus assembly protein PilO